MSPSTQQTGADERLVHWLVRAARCLLEQDEAFRAPVDAVAAETCAGESMVSPEWPVREGDLECPQTFVREPVTADTMACDGEDVSAAARSPRPTPGSSHG